MDSFLLTADRHLRTGDCVWPSRPEIRGDGAFAQQEILRVADERQVAAVRDVGDAFDVRPQRADVIGLSRQYLDELGRRGLPLYVVQGNHDYVAPPTAPVLCEINPGVAVHA